LAAQRLAGRIALVTGASRGIGAAVAKALAAEGAQPILVARSQGGLEEVDDAIRAAGGKATLVPLDLLEFDKIDQVALAIAERFGKLDILCGIAGTLGGGLYPVGHIPVDLMDQLFGLNVIANWRLLRALDPLLKQSDAGRAIFATCSVSTGIQPYWGPYAASKAALEALVRSYAGETQKTNIRANMVDPGAVATKLRGLAFPGEDQKTLPQPDSVAPLFVDLALPECKRHGQVLRAV
jgi:NAD(P)-dependent dehydrogenase (short-subunit alcohol dehydrogenase family)